MVGFYNYTVILTYFGVFSAILGVGFAAGGNAKLAVVCLMVSGFCDLFDGTVARTRERTTQEKKFGIQIDSLADLICFGVLPAAIGHAVGLTRWYEMGLLALYVLAALIRLAYYNVTEDELQNEKMQKRTHYEGMPVTTAALLFPLLFVAEPFMGNAFQYLYLGWALLVATAFLVKIKVKKLGIVGMVAAAFVGAGVLVMLIVYWNV